MANCNSCKFMLLNEQEQEELYRLTHKKYGKQDHICSKHNVRIFHYGKHPILVPYYECNGKDFVARIRCPFCKSLKTMQLCEADDDIPAQHMCLNCRGEWGQ